jgi:hypothetical protein
MPRVGDPSRPATSSTPAAPTTPTPPADPTHPPGPGAPTPPADPAATFDPASGVEVYFTPYDPAVAVEQALVDKVVAARKADPKQYAAGQNPHRIRYAVYNLRHPQLIAKLIEAVKAGVDVQVMIDAKQVSPQRPHNKVDDWFEDAGLSVLRSDKGVPEAERRAAHLVGIHSSHLMHMKARLYSYKDPATGEVKQEVLSGSMNPGAGGANDENLNRITDPEVLKLYAQKLEDVMMHKRTRNEWSDQRGINVLFTPCEAGPRPIEKLFEMIDAEKESILMNVFDLNNLIDPGSRKTLADKLAAAKARGVEVVVITDRKKSDGKNLDGSQATMYGRPAQDDPTDELLEAAGIPVYEVSNTVSQYASMHAKQAIFGLTDPKVLTGAGNWTRPGIGSGDKRAKNEESFIFLDSAKLGDRRVADRYLSNFLYVLRHYDGQDKDHDSATKCFARLSQRSGWPTVPVDPGSLLPPGVEEGWLVGDHPALKPDAGEPGVLVRRSSSTTGVRAATTIDLPFGAQLAYEVVERKPDGGRGAEHADLSLVVLGDAATPRI